MRTSPAVARWGGLIASIVLALSSWWCAATPEQYAATLWPGLHLSRPGDGGSPLAATIAWLAVAALVALWWGLRDAPLGVGWWRRTALAWFGPLVFSAPLLSRDIYSYAAQGLLLVQGFDPYSGGVDRLHSPWVDATSSVWLDTPAPYGPVFLLLARAAAGFAEGNLLVALALLRLAAVAAVVLLFWVLPRLAEVAGIDPGRASWLGLATPLVGVHLVSGGHNEAIMVALLALGWLLAARHHPVWALLVLAVAAAIKLPALVVLPFIAVHWAVDQARTRGVRLTWPRVAVTSVAAGLLTIGGFLALCYGSGLGLGALSVADTAGRTVAWTSIPSATGIGLAAIGHLLGLPGDQAAYVDPARTVGLAVLAVGLVAGWLLHVRWVVRSSRPAQIGVVATGWALLAVAVMGPAYHGWYALWGLPFLAAALDSRPARRWLAAITTGLGLFVKPDGFTLALRTAAVGVPLVFGALAWGLRHALRHLTAYEWSRALDLGER